MRSPSKFTRDLKTNDIYREMADDAMLAEFRNLAVNKTASCASVQYAPIVIIVVHCLMFSYVCLTVIRLTCKFCSQDR